MADDRSLADADAFRFAKFGAAIDDDPRAHPDAGGTIDGKAKLLGGNVADKTEKEEFQAVAVPAVLTFDHFELGYNCQDQPPAFPSRATSLSRFSVPTCKRAVVNVGCTALLGVAM